MVRFIVQFINLFLNASILTACCATSLCMATERLINGSSPGLATQLHMLVFGSTLLVYNAPRIFRKPLPHERRFSSLLDHYRFWYFVFFGTGLVMVLTGLVWLPASLLIGCMVLGLITFSYSLPLLPFNNKRRLRDFGWLKILVLSGVWTIVTSVLPILYWHKTIAQYPIEIVQRLAFIFTLCIIFDIRDIKTDFNNNILTLPQKLGIKNSYRLINGTLILFAALSIVQYLRFPVTERLLGALLTAFATKLVVRYLQKYPTNVAYLALADGVMLLYAFLILIPN